ncbi:unnamed protein product, partial [Protopolystoma xenopodis]
MSILAPGTYPNKSIPGPQHQIQLCAYPASQLHGHPMQVTRAIAPNVMIRNQQPCNSHVMEQQNYPHIIQQQQPPVSAVQDTSQIGVSNVPFLKDQLVQLRAQINAYKLLSKSQPVSDVLLLAAEGRVNATGQHPSLQAQQQPCFLQSSPRQRPGVPIFNVGGQPNLVAGCFGSPVGYGPYAGPAQNAAFLASSAQVIGRNRLTPLQKPKGLDPVELLKEREQRIQSRVVQRINFLTNLSAFMTNEQRVNSQIELRSLRLLNFQRQLRQDIVSSMRKDTSLETALNV